MLVDKAFDEEDYNPKNYYEGYRGANTMRYYLTISGNTPAVRAFYEVRDEFGQDAIQSFVENVGIEPSMSGDEMNASNALGAAEASTTQMAAAYAALGTNGMYTKPHVIQKIEFNDGSTINSPIKPKQAMEDYTAYMLTDMLRDVVSGSNGTYEPGAFPWDVAGKTGTTNEDMDKWFTGYTTDYSISVWTGRSNATDVSMMKPNYAQYYFEYMMQQVTNATGQPDRFQQPESVLSLGNELYVKGTKPKDLQPDKLAAPTGASIDYDVPAETGTLSWSYDTQGVQAAGYQGLSFTVTETRPDGSERVVGTTEDTSIAIAGLPEGQTTFTIVANATNSLVGAQQSSPLQTSYTVERSEEPPAEEEEEPVTEETPPAEEGEQTDGENNGNNGNNENNENNGNDTNTEEENTEEPTEEEPPTDQTEGETDSNGDVSRQSTDSNGQDNGNGNGNGNGGRD
ncbi:penicillin-binding transpeptidase domain-containing protein [Exiguobacterium sp. AM39-5BH]|uniref:penicillin-binding transpeptidase domain-containing protein n=1 Tax=Exiguobacterium sp. AM39-5BH TaxID=2292355 RepID=UPI001F3884B4|nr:penicillin-binding transpeptidase domain-containing protein [Exiguobacterium sp. AM39-5BH]